MDTWISEALVVPETAYAALLESLATREAQGELPAATGRERSDLALRILVALKTANALNPPPRGTEADRPREARISLAPEVEASGGLDGR